MGCLRLGQAAFSALLMTALFTLLGGLLGGAFFSLLVSHSEPTLALNAPGIYVGGGVGGGVGVLLALSVVREMTQRDWLRRHGTHIRAHVIEVETRFSLPFGGPVGDGDLPHRVYYVVVAEWTDPSTHQRYLFRSEYLEPPSRVARGDSVAVHIDPQNPSRYLMEV